MTLTENRDPSMRVAVLTISDAGARGERADTSGDAAAEWAEWQGATVVARAVVPDDTVEIVRVLLAWCDDDVADLVLTTGGTGLSARDVTPEATRAVIEREADGIAPSALSTHSSRTFCSSAPARSSIPVETSP